MKPTKTINIANDANFKETCEKVIKMLQALLFKRTGAKMEYGKFHLIIHENKIHRIDACPVMKLVKHWENEL